MAASYISLYAREITSLNMREGNTKSKKTWIKEISALGNYWIVIMT